MKMCIKPLNQFNKTFSYFPHGFVYERLTFSNDRKTAESQEKFFRLVDLLWYEIKFDSTSRPNAEVSEHFEWDV